MPATRDQIRRQKIVDHTVDFGDGVEATFRFDANKMTDAWMETWTLAESETNAPQTNQMLADLIIEWDIFEDEGGPVIPVTADEIGKLFSFPDKMKLIKEFVGLPSDAEGNASRNISSTPNTNSTSVPASPQNGPPTSLTPEPVASPSLPQPT